MIASTQIRITEIFTFIASNFYKLLSRKVLFIDRKDNRTFRNETTKIYLFKEREKIES